MRYTMVVSLDKTIVIKCFQKDTFRSEFIIGSLEWQQSSVVIFKAFSGDHSCISDWDVFLGCVGHCFVLGFIVVGWLWVCLGAGVFYVGFVCFEENLNFFNWENRGRPLSNSLKILSILLLRWTVINEKSERNVIMYKLSTLQKKF